MATNNLSQLLRNRPDLNWYVSDVTKMDDEPALEAILNYGDWTDFKTSFEILGPRRFKKMFHRISDTQRSNLRPEIKHYFGLYLTKHV